MARLDPLERLERVLEDINKGVSDALGNEDIALEQRLTIAEFAVPSADNIAEIIKIIRPFYEEPPEG